MRNLLVGLVGVLWAAGAWADFDNVELRACWNQAYETGPCTAITHTAEILSSDPSEAYRFTLYARNIDDTEADIYNNVCYVRASWTQDPDDWEYGRFFYLNLDDDNSGPDGAAFLHNYADHTRHTTAVYLMPPDYTVPGGSLLDGSDWRELGTYHFSVEIFDPEGDSPVTATAWPDLEECFPEYCRNRTGAGITDNIPGFPNTSVDCDGQVQELDGDVTPFEVLNSFGSAPAIVNRLELTVQVDWPDEDGVANYEDNCTKIANFDQADADSDLYGDVCDPNCDVNSDRITGSPDLSILIGNWGKTGDPGTIAGDCNNDGAGDGIVGFPDYNDLLSEWGMQLGPSGHVDE